MDETIRVPKRILSTLLTSIAAGVVPRSGAPYIAIGRTDEIAALLSDLDNGPRVPQRCALSSVNTAPARAFFCS